MTIDSIIAEIAASGFQLSLSQSPRGWEVILWTGPIGYSNYTASTADSPALALSIALIDLRSTGGKALDSNATRAERAEASLALSSILASLTPPAEPIRRRLK